MKHEIILEISELSVTKMLDHYNDTCIRMCPELIDAIAISTLGEYPSEAGRFVGSNVFGYKNKCGYSIRNLGKIESNTISKPVFIPPASPVNKKILGIVTVNKTLSMCSMDAVDSREGDKIL